MSLVSLSSGFSKRQQAFVDLGKTQSDFCLLRLIGDRLDGDDWISLSLIGADRTVLDRPTAPAPLGVTVADAILRRKNGWGRHIGNLLLTRQDHSLFGFRLARFRARCQK